MKDFFNSVASYFSNRLKSHLYGTFTFWWIIFHWPFFYSLLFLDQNLILKKTGMLKDEYLKANYFDFKYFYFWWELMLPFLMTYVTIKYMPKLILMVYKIEKNDDFAKQEVNFEYKKKVEKLRASLEEKKVDTLQVVKERVEKEQDIEVIESSAWEKDYQKFKKTNLYNDFDEIIESLYEHSGNLKEGWVSGENYRFQVSTDILVYSHSNDLVKLDKDNESIEITEKGKYFVRRYTLDQEA